MISGNRINLEMTMHTLDREISDLSDLVYEIDEFDLIYLKELYAQMGKLVERVDFKVGAKWEMYSRGAA